MSQPGTKPAPPISNVYSAEPTALIKRLSEKLRTYPDVNVPREVKLGFWKTSCAKEFAPENDDFWFVRAASLLRRLALKKEIGVSRLRKEYGSRQRNGLRPARFRKASGKIIRRILQQLEKAGLVAIEKSAGRKLTPTGHSLVDKVAHEIVREATVSK
ncbi:MAG: 30S ribosomal protein S19e [Candidatus Lokiarchaeota archaeon]|nr:30S ribosomal protein S19e [Candidatus Lokiarchaeota archaeon]